MFYWVRLGAGAFVALAVLLYVWSVLGPVHEERPARMDVAPQRPAPAE